MEAMAPTEHDNPSSGSATPHSEISYDSSEETMSRRKKIVIVGLGMVAISFMYVLDLRAKCMERTKADIQSEKMLKLDAERRQYDIVVIGEEEHVAYNRVGLSTFFEHRRVEDLYLNSQEWVSGKERW